MNKLIVDRIEENILVCIDREGNTVFIDKEKADNAKPGDVISLKTDGKYCVLKDETEKRHKEILDLQNSLWE